ncbi:MAG: hypothetical protein BDTLLHRC_000509, partial [Candidatus Fervidibacter sp.]
RRNSQPNHDRNTKKKRRNIVIAPFAHGLSPTRRPSMLRQRPAFRYPPQQKCPNLSTLHRSDLLGEIQSDFRLRGETEGATDEGGAVRVDGDEGTLLPVADAKNRLR